MKKGWIGVVVGLGLLVPVFGAQDVKENPRGTIEEVTVTSGTAVWISATAKSRQGSVDLYIKNAASDSTDAYWKLRDNREVLTTVDNDGATLAASTGWILIENVQWDWGIEAVGTDIDVQIWEGGDR